MYRVRPSRIRARPCASAAHRIQLSPASGSDSAALRSLTFKGAGPAGADIYEIKFDGGVIDWRIVLAPDGKVAGLGIRKMP
jgi:hypothetical protein